MNQDKMHIVNKIFNNGQELNINYYALDEVIIFGHGRLKTF